MRLLLLNMLLLELSLILAYSMLSQSDLDLGMTMTSFEVCSKERTDRNCMYLLAQELYKIPVARSEQRYEPRTHAPFRVLMLEDPATSAITNTSAASWNIARSGLSHVWTLQQH